MKVGILTFHWANNRNFGASLQSYACKELFNKILNTNNTEIINYNPTNFNIIKKGYHFLIGSSFSEYNNKFLKLTKEIKSIGELKELNNQFDIFVVGSDQVWRGIWFLENKEHYFFDFVNEDKKKIAYAASFGVEYWEGTPKLTEKIKPLIKKFNHISVREKSGIDICKNIFDVKAEWVLDPTLMLKKEDYQSILDEWTDKKHLKEKYIAYGLLKDDKNLQNFCEKLSKKLNFQIKVIKGNTFNILGKNITLFNKVSQWLTYLKDSEFVITDSFHCTVFSLIFHKKFIVFPNKGGGVARLKSLLSMLGLEERFIVDINSCNIEKIIDKEIDYKEIDKRLKKEKEKSFDFLKKALGVN